MVHPVAHQLTVTNRGLSPFQGPYPPNEWDLSDPKLNGKKRSKMSVIAIGATAHRYGRVGALSTAAGNTG